MKKHILLALSILSVITLSACKQSPSATASIENITFGSTYDKMSALGEPNAVTPVKDEAVMTNKGYYVTAEYDGLMITLSTESDFALTSTSSVVAVTALSDAYADFSGMKVGMSKTELMQKYSLAESDFLSGKENAEMYRIPDTNFITHNIPAYDTFYVAENEDNPIVLIYLIKDERINAILLRHLTAD